MSDDRSGSPLQRAQQAASRGEWEVAFDLYQDADASGQVGVADLPMLADVAYASGHLDVTIAVWERAYAALMAAGETIAAAGAAVRVAMHLLFDTALMAPVRGWLARAEHLLVDAESTPAHAWFAVVRAYERMMIGDRESARACTHFAPSTSARYVTTRPPPSGGSQRRVCSFSTVMSKRVSRSSTKPAWL